MYNIIERGGRPIIMTHINRPYDKKTKNLTVKQDDAVDAVVAYLQRKLRIKFAVPQFHINEKEGIHDIDTSINWLIQDLRARKIGGIYLPNTRWFAVSAWIVMYSLLFDAFISGSIRTCELVCVLMDLIFWISGRGRQGRQHGAIRSAIGGARRCVRERRLRLMAASRVDIPHYEILAIIRRLVHAGASLFLSKSFELCFRHG